MNEQRIEEIEKIIRAYDETNGPTVDETAQQIAKLFEPTAEDRLLTPREMSTAIAEHRHILELVGHKPNTQDARLAVAEAQRDLTAVAKAREWERRYNKTRADYHEITEKLKAECQARVEEIFAEIEKAYRHEDEHYMLDGMVDCRFRCVSENSIEAFKAKYLKEGE